MPIQKPDIDIDAIAYYQTRAYDFVCDYILAGTKIMPTWQQKQALDEISQYDRVAARSGHGPGKTAVFSWIAIWFVWTRPAPVRVPCTAPSYHQLQDILWPEISHWLSKSILRDKIKWRAEKIVYIGEEKTKFAVPRTCDYSDNLQGFHAPHLLWILDEAFGIKNPMNFEVIEGSCTGEDNKILMGGNPTVITGYVHDAFHKDKAKWRCLTWNAEESPIVLQDHIKDMAEKYGKNSDVYRVRVLGLPPLGNPNAFIRLVDIEAAVVREVEPGGEVNFGVDCARFGDDLTVIARAWGFHYFPLVKRERTDEVQIYELVIGTCREFRDKTKYAGQINIKIDVTGGYGAGAYDLLRRNTTDNLNVIPITFTAAGNEEYKNSTSVMWGEFRASLDQMHLPDDTELVAELSTREWKFVSDQGREKVLIEPKAAYKERRKENSPDRSDAVVLAWTRKAVKRLVFSGFDGEYAKFNVNWKELDPDRNILVISEWVEKNLKTSVVIGIYNKVAGRLYFIGEDEFDNPRPEVVVPAILRKIILVSGGVIKDLKKFQWYGAPDMFEKSAGDMAAVYLKQSGAMSVWVQQNKMYEENGSILSVSRMMFRRQIAIPESCPNIMLQLSGWTIEKDAPAEGYGLARAILLVVSALYESGMIRGQQEYVGYHPARVKGFAAAEKAVRDDKIGEFNKGEDVGDTKYSDGDWV